MTQSKPDSMRTPAVAMPGMLAQIWAEGMQAAIGSLTNSPVSIAVTASETQDPVAGELEWWSQAFHLTPAPAFWVGASQESWIALGRAVLGALGVEDPAPEDIQGTCRDLLSQASGALVERLKQTLGEEVTSGELAQRERLDTASTEVFHFSAVQGLAGVGGLVVFDRSFLDRLNVTRSGAEIQAPPLNKEDAPGNSATESYRQRIAAAPKVELALKVVLGLRQLPLREVFKWNVGSVIELDRTCSDPADVLINDHRFAEGQVVVVAGNYGVRITARSQHGEK